MPAAFFKIVIKHHPDGRNTGGKGNFFLSNGTTELLHVNYFPAGKHLLTASSHRGKGSAPGIGMEHGYNMKYAVSLTGAKGNGNGKGMQDKSPVRIHDSFRVTRGCR